MIKVFVGASEEQLIPSLVLEYTIRKYSSLSVEVVPLYQKEISFRMPKDKRNRPRTPFSFQRFAIPQLTTGKAFYLDSDMIVFKDMAPLLDLDFEGHEIISVREVGKTGHQFSAKPSFAVHLIDCDKVNWDLNKIVDQLDEGKLTYESLMFDFAIADYTLKIGPEWNHLDYYKEGETALLHYTNMNSQPWRPQARKSHKLAYLWKDALREAIAEGIVKESLVEDNIRKGWVRKEVLE